ncbi:TMEM108 incomplete domain containing protein [Pandoravirus macleodensis]|uniref:TMEM108 incomplete domain containing protein n=1 Tax=Pandoravirus macleodensis TaxID=2107707 RepID=A0A2U7UG11_9VIRU|nr:TMEM108 incomplete domain containing protein [Pandoravirus macleodensis]AVK77260.1 TMEM108 incomplete domain containing protein [Pandoravirus macleodensis]
MTTSPRTTIRGRHSISTRAARGYMRYAGRHDYTLWDAGLPRHAPAGLDERQTRPFWEKLALNRHTGDGRKNMPAPICGVASASKRLADDLAARATIVGHRPNITGIMDALHPDPQRPATILILNNPPPGPVLGIEPACYSVAVTLVSLGDQDVMGNTPSPVEGAMVSHRVSLFTADRDNGISPTNINTHTAPYEGNATERSSSDEGEERALPKNNVDRDAIEAYVFGSGDSTDDDALLDYRDATDVDKDVNVGDVMEEEMDDSESNGDIDWIEYDYCERGVDHHDENEDEEETDGYDSDDGGRSDFSSNDEGAEKQEHSDSEYEDSDPEYSHTLKGLNSNDGNPASDGHDSDSDMGAFYVRRTRNMRFACVVDIVSRATGVTNRRLLDNMLQCVLSHDDSKWLGLCEKKFDIGSPEMAAIPIALVGFSAEVMATALRANDAYARYADRMDAWRISNDMDCLPSRRVVSQRRRAAHSTRWPRAEADQSEMITMGATMVRKRTPYYVRSRNNDGSFSIVSTVAPPASAGAPRSKHDAPPPPPNHTSTSESDDYIPGEGDASMPPEEAFVTNHAALTTSKSARSKGQSTTRLAEKPPVRLSSRSQSRCSHAVWKNGRRGRTHRSGWVRRVQFPALHAATERPHHCETDPLGTDAEVRYVEISPIEVQATISHHVPEADDPTGDENDPSQRHDETDERSGKSISCARCSSGMDIVSVRDVVGHAFEMRPVDIQESEAPSRHNRDSMDIAPGQREDGKDSGEAPSPLPCPSVSKNREPQNAVACDAPKMPVRPAKRHRFSSESDASPAFLTLAQTLQQIGTGEGEDCIDLTADAPFPSHVETRIRPYSSGLVLPIKRERPDSSSARNRGGHTIGPIKTEPCAADRRDGQDLCDSFEPLDSTSEEREHNHGLVDRLAAQIGLKDERGNGDSSALCVWCCNRTTGEQRPVFAARRQWDSDDTWVVTYGTDSIEGAARSAPAMFKWWRVRQLVCDRLLSPWTSVYVGLMTAPDTRKQIVSIVSGGFFSSCQRWISDASLCDGRVSLQEGRRLLARARLLCISAVDAEHGCECAQLRDRLADTIQQFTASSP